ncbi:MAG: hypothetical protein JWQ71_3724 [Pedosphaera sp.]|nr:hypothetical protein [Pedosphaera sp.]
MAARFQSRRWRICRRIFRGIRIAILLLIFLLVAFGAYLNQIGLPDFLKRPLLEKMHARGLDLQFSRVRLRWYRGIVAENVQFGRVDPQATSPQLSLKEVEVKLNHDALKRFKLNVDSLIFQGGRLVWALEETNRPRQELLLSNIQTQLRFQTNDLWELDHFKASFAGANLQLSGSLTNASQIRDWKIFKPKGEHPSKRGQETLRRVAETIEKIKFAGTPEMKLTFHGDARDLESFDAALTVNALGADTPWGILTNGVLVTRLIPPGTNNSHPKVEFQLHADDANTRWGATKNFQLGLRVVSDGNLTNVAECRMDILTDRFTTEWAQATNAQFTAQWTHALTNPIPISGSGELKLADARTKWGTAGGIELTGRINTLSTNGPSQANEQWAWWAKLEPYALDWHGRLTDVHAREFQVKEVACGGFWRAPELTVTNIYSELYQGRLNAKAKLNVATRSLAFENTSDFDAQQVASLLTEKGRQWLQRFSWEKPPLVQGSGSLTLPAWTNRHPDWRGEVLPTMVLQGEFKIGPSAFRKIPVSSAHSHLSYSNMVWQLPDLVAVRPEGEVRLEHRANDRTKDYYFRVHSTVDANIARPLFTEPKQQRALEMISLPQPPVIDGEIWGRWNDNERIGFKGQIAVSNVTFRGETATSFRANAEYTNRFLTLTDGRVERGTQYMTASKAIFDFTRKQAAITNGFSTMEPAPLLRTIGPKVANIMEPYQFLQAPTVRMNGIIPLAGNVPADAHFEIDGGPFHWLKFNAEHISGGAHWVGDHLLLSEVKSSFYEGTLTGTASFDFTHTQGTDFSFDIIATDSNLQKLMTDLATHTNNLEGRLSGHLSITSANTRDTNSWFGKGQVDLHNGFIWAIPIFGIFSQPLDDLVPGLGKSRASEGSGTFIITNSVIRSDNFEIRAPAMRMQYHGAVTFGGQVNATVEAELLRDTWLIGRVVSTVLWPLTKVFEYKVTGTLAHPNAQPLYIFPKILFMPFHPVKSLKQILPGDSNGTNAPPVIKSP